MFTANATIEQKGSLEELKPSLVGSYVVNGTDADGKRYSGNILSIALRRPFGALELDWEGGKQAGVGQAGNVLAVAYSMKGRPAILVMNINPDGRSPESGRITQIEVTRERRGGRKYSVSPAEPAAIGRDCLLINFRKATGRPRYDSDEPGNLEG